MAGSPPATKIDGVYRVDRHRRQGRVRQFRKPAVQSRSCPTARRRHRLQQPAHPGARQQRQPAADLVRPPTSSTARHHRRSCRRYPGQRLGHDQITNWSTAGVKLLKTLPIAKGMADNAISGSFGIAADAERIYVADTPTHSVKVYTKAGVFVGEDRSARHRQGQTVDPDGIAVDKGSFTSPKRATSDLGVQPQRQVVSRQTEGRARSARGPSAFDLSSATAAESRARQAPGRCWCR